MLSEESILDLWSPGRPTLGKNKVIAFARAIEREAYKQGQERMRAMAAKECSKNIEIGDACKAIRNLEIEEPTE